MVRAWLKNLSEGVEFFTTKPYPASRLSQFCNDMFSITRNQLTMSKNFSTEKWGGVDIRLSSSALSLSTLRASSEPQPNSSRPKGSPPKGSVEALNFIVAYPALALRACVHE